MVFSSWLRGVNQESFLQTYDLTNENKLKNLRYTHTRNNFKWISFPSYLYATHITDWTFHPTHTFSFNMACYYLGHKYLHYNDQPIKCDKSQQRWYIEQQVKKEVKKKKKNCLCDLIRMNGKVNDFERQIKLVPFF